jgi:quinol monooxygenase YgiN
MSQKAIHVFAKWVVQGNKLEIVLGLLQELAKKTKIEEGNLFYTLHQSTTDPNIIILFEGYKDEAGLNFHKNSDHYKKIVVEQVIPLLKEREVTLTNPLE